jgi:hypothetical protein
MPERLKILVGSDGTFLALTAEDCKLILSTRDVEQLIERLSIARMQMMPPSSLQAEAARLGSPGTPGR